MCQVLGSIERDSKGSLTKLLESERQRKLGRGEEGSPRRRRGHEYSLGVKISAVYSESVRGSI